MKSDKLEGTIWEKIDDRKIKLDAKELEFLYQKESIQNTAPLPSQAKFKPTKVTRLQPERLKNVEMILSRLKVSAVAVKEALLQIDFEFLNQDRIELVKNAGPEKDEVDLYLNNPLEDPTNSAAPDLFYAEIC